MYHALLLFSFADTLALVATTAEAHLHSTIHEA